MLAYSEVTGDINVHFADTVHADRDCREQTITYDYGTIMHWAYNADNVPAMRKIQDAGYRYQKGPSSSETDRVESVECSHEGDGLRRAVNKKLSDYSNTFLDEEDREGVEAVAHDFEGGASGLVHRSGYQQLGQ
jgi:hypothetical protein